MRSSSLKERILDMSTTLQTFIDVGISRHIGKYSDAVEVRRPARWLFTSGTPGLTPDGSLPETFELQAEQAWKNILSALHKAGMGREHLVVGRDGS
jgi:2-iminobutanoate/2-iminopropanoate deaminase